MLYESFIHPLTILSTLPSAGLGALLTLIAVGREPLNVIGIIAIILLIGIVKKNGIMIVDVALTLERGQGITSEAAIREASHQRLRPIMMTTACAALGGVPMILMNGTGAEFRQPLGYAIVGGLIVSQALTLFTTPVSLHLFLTTAAAARQPPRQHSTHRVPLREIIGARANTVALTLRVPCVLRRPAHVHSAIAGAIAVQRVLTPRH